MFAEQLDNYINNVFGGTIAIEAFEDIDNPHNLYKVFTTQQHSFMTLSDEQSIAQIKNNEKHIATWYGDDYTIKIEFATSIGRDNMGKHPDFAFLFFTYELNDLSCKIVGIASLTNANNMYWLAGVQSEIKTEETTLEEAEEHYKNFYNELNKQAALFYQKYYEDMKTKFEINEENDHGK